MKVNKIKDGHIENLVLEITRECNFKCAHCLRGPAQNKDLDLFEFRQFLFANDVKSISKLTITGGEPLMRANLIKSLVSDFRCSDIEILSCYIATNGSYFNKESLEALYSLYNILDGYLTVEISNSTYHQTERDRLNLTHYDDKEINKNEILYSIINSLEEKFQDEFPDELDMMSYHVDAEMHDIFYLFEQDDFIISMDSRKYLELLSEGRGRKIGGYKEAESVSDIIYFSAKGEVVLDKCDLSFKSIRKEKVLKIA